MCDTCGCGQPNEAVTFRRPGQDHDHAPDHHHDHQPGRHLGHPHSRGPEGVVRTIDVQQDVLQQNALLAERNRGWFEAMGILAVNLMSSPGSGKTTLLERTIADLADGPPVAVIEGDQQTMRDAERIAATGAAVLQVNTGRGCHLDAQMIRRAVDELQPPPGSLLMIENVGNLVCPALFDLGEAAKVVIVSVTEGDDKPLKYPHMFAAAQLCLVNKIDLMPHVDFGLDRFAAALGQVNPRLEFLQVSAATGQGLDAWYEWLRGKHRIR